MNWEGIDIYAWEALGQIRRASLPRAPWDKERDTRARERAELENPRLADREGDGK